MSEEIWKDIPGYEGKYQASNQGRVKSLSRVICGANQFGRFEWLSKEKILRPGTRSILGYQMVVLNNPRKTFAVHHLVMMSFVGARNNQYVLHANGNPTDNRLINLRYGSQSENVIDVYHQGKAWKKFTIDDVYDIRFELLCGFSCSSIAKKYGVGHQAISKIKNGERFKWLK